MSQAKYQFEVRDVELREPDRNEVEVAVKACGFCGHDNILANYAATEWEPFGHEFAGIVTKIGAEVQNVAVGDRVAIETSTFNRSVIFIFRPPRSNVYPHFI